MKDSSCTVQLSNSDTLECDNGYWEDNGTLETLDNSTCTLQVGANSDGTATIAASGWVIINAPNNGFGTLNVNAATLDFNGRLVVSIWEGASTTSDLLNVSGTTNLQAVSTLTVYDRGGPGGEAGRGLSSKMRAAT